MTHAHKLTQSELQSKNNNKMDLKNSRVSPRGAARYIFGFPFNEQGDSLQAVVLPSGEGPCTMQMKLCSRRLSGQKLRFDDLHSLVVGLSQCLVILSKKNYN